MPRGLCFFMQLRYLSNIYNRQDYQFIASVVLCTSSSLFLLRPGLSLSDQPPHSAHRHRPQ
jgi:hypothetical protein